MPLNARHLAETRQSLRPIRPEHQQRPREDQRFEGGKTSITMSIGKLDGGTTENHGETRRQHLQLRSDKTHNDFRVGVHGNLHHLRNGGDLVLLERIPENRRGL